MLNKIELFCKLPTNKRELQLSGLFRAMFEHEENIATGRLNFIELKAGIEAGLGKSFLYMPTSPSFNCHNI